MMGSSGRRVAPGLWDLASPFIPQSLPTPFRARICGGFASFSTTVSPRFSASGISGLNGKRAKYVVSRSFASSGILMLSPCQSNTVLETAAAKSVGLEVAACFSKSSLRRACAGHSVFARPTFRNSFSTSAAQREGRDEKETSSKGEPSAETSPKQKVGSKDDQDNSTATQDHTSSRVSFVSANKHLMDRLPQLPHLHRPTKEELLAAATGFWSRLKVRFKWFSIRSGRPFNTDDIGAFVSWIFLGHMVWIIVGTTTFFSLLIFAINTVFAQETLARWVGNYLTKSSGVKVVFESAIVPKWGDGVITLKNVFVSRRPGQGKSNVSKGSAQTAAAVAATRNTSLEGDHAVEDQEEEEEPNYTQFDISIDTVNVTLSFTKWFNGKGPLRDVEVKGIRGVVDRTHVHWNGHENVDPKSYRHEHNPGDFEIDSFKMEDVLLTLYQPNNFRPFSISIFSCDLPQLRKQFLFYDFMSANNMSGSFDNSLFTIHPRQTHNYTGAQLDNGFEVDKAGNPWKRHSRIRVDGLNIDHLNRGVQGPFSWIYEGNVDIVADIMFPTDDDESIAKVMADFYDRLETTVTSNKFQPYSSIHDGGSDRETRRFDPIRSSKDNDGHKRFLVMDLRVHLNDVRASVPIFTRDLSYVNNALIRPIVAYINSRRTFIPIHCRVVKRVSDFDGSWTLFDSGLMDDLSAETYDAFSRDIADDQARLRRFKKVGLWSLQVAAQAIFMGMAGNII